MKKTIIIITLILCGVLLVPIMLGAITFLTPAQYDESFYGGMGIKYERLRETEGRRVIVIGGSNVAFGLRSDLLSQELGMEVVNFGLYANLGTKYMLDVAKDYIREGDIVVITPEQSSQSLSLYFNAEAAWFAIDGNYRMLFDLAPDNAGDMVTGFLSYASGKFGYSRSGAKPCPAGVYNVHAFNEYGDISYVRNHNVMSLGYDAATPILFDESMVDVEFIDYLNDYAEDLTEQGAEVLYGFCPMNGEAVSADDAQILSYYRMLEEKLEFDILGTPFSRIMDDDWFYDSNFHLNDAGSRLYTRILAQDLKARAGDYSPVTIPLPEAPEAEETPLPDTEVEGESTDLTEAAKIFNLSIVDNRDWQIDSLTDYGKTLTEIRIPDAIAGLPVRYITDQAFAGNRIVQKIWFGQHVSSVALNAFSGCSALNAIYITSQDPSSFSPNKDILAGADNCVIYIPAAVYSSKYLPDYFWGAIDHSRLKSY